MSHYGIAKSPDRLETQALGSCVGIALYDPQTKLGGIAHPMLPDMSVSKKSARANLGKYVNTAIELLIEKMEEEGAHKRSIKAKLTGGANMFPDLLGKDTIHIGQRNIEAAKKQLEVINIPIVAEDTGGSLGRTIILDTKTGRLCVRTVAHGEREI